MTDHLANLQFHPLTASRWTDFETLFGPRGACGGCWCMLWRMKRVDFERDKGPANKRRMQAIVNAGKPPGILAYPATKPSGVTVSDKPTPIGWCAVGPRESYASLQRSRILKPIDDRPVWSVTCLFVKKGLRRQGVSVQLLRAAQEHARKQGAKILEGYPVEPRNESMPDVFAWTGLARAFLAAGFSECLRRSETRPIMRAELTGRKPRHKR